jgi:hypothetical protein
MTKREPTRIKAKTAMPIPGRSNMDCYNVHTERELKWRKSAHEEQCRYCGLFLPPSQVCRNTNDLEDSDAKVCFAALISHGGGTKIINLHLAGMIISCVERLNPKGKD